jgi:branched-chain amino acid aminotransferase
MSFENSKWVWMNGKPIPWQDATVHVSAHGLHYGTGVFEGVRCYKTNNGPALFRLDAHLDRLYFSASVYEMEIPYTKEDLIRAICDVVRRNEFESCYVRPLCFRDSASLGIKAKCPVTVTILAWPWSGHHTAESLKKGVSVTVSPWTKMSPRMIPTKAKASGQYLNSLLAAREAARRGYDEALLLNLDGEIAEGAVENLFIVKDKIVRTNDESASILPGITRDSAIRIAEDLGYKVEIGRMVIEDLLSADEAFFTGTAAEIAPIREVDGHLIGEGSRGPITSRIQETFYQAVSGSLPQYKEWLLEVNN